MMTITDPQMRLGSMALGFLDVICCGEKIGGA
jgi:hypothetical protein